MAEVRATVPDGDRVVRVPTVTLAGAHPGLTAYDRLVWVYNRLHQPIAAPWRFANMPLLEVTESISKSEGIEIRLNRGALIEAEAAIDEHTPVTFSYPRGALGTGLAWMLEPWSLAYLPSAEGEKLLVEITSAENASQAIHTVVYPLGQLTEGFHGSTWDKDSCVVAIQEFIGPSTWKRVGGRGTITFPLGARALCASNVWPVQLKIYEFLRL